jgi:hypothetical protein
VGIAITGFEIWIALRINLTETWCCFARLFGFCANLPIGAVRINVAAVWLVNTHMDLRVTSHDGVVAVCLFLTITGFQYADFLVQITGLPFFAVIVAAAAR